MEKREAEGGRKVSRIYHPAVPGEDQKLESFSYPKEKCQGPGRL
jgi:hypothetical protein